MVEYRHYKRDRDTKLYLNYGDVYTKYGLWLGGYDWTNWQPYLRNMERYIKQKPFNTRVGRYSISDILYWFKFNIIDHIGISRWNLEDLNGFSSEKRTLDVRMRIVCGMVNKSKMPTTIKHELMELMFWKYKELQEDYYEWYCHWVLKLPF